MMDKATKHTPSDWRLVIRTETNGALTLPPYVETNNPLPGHGETICMLGVTNLHYANAEANGRLIAAAPELLAELVAFEQLICDGESDDLGYHVRVVPICIKRVEAIRAAIAKATQAA